MDRHARRLNHVKNSRLVDVSRAPMVAEGNDGDLYLHRGTAGGATLYIKAAGRWFDFSNHEPVVDGWHGSKSKIRVMPSDLMNGNATGTNDIKMVATFGYVGFENSGIANKLCTNIFIPIGFKATHVKIYGVHFAGSGVATDPTIAVYEGSFSATGVGSSLGGDDINTEFNLTTSLESHDDSYIQIDVNGIFGENNSVGSWMIRGGYVKIAPIIAERNI